jgi:hypothetical protein
VNLVYLAGNVPYLAEAFPDWPASKQVEVLTGEDGGEVALFRSQSWRGVDGRDDFHPTPQAMADRLGALPRGTVTWVYMTSDGGLSFENSYQALLPLLPEHVTLVSADAAAGLVGGGGGGRTVRHQVSGGLAGSPWGGGLHRVRGRSHQGA